MVRKRDGLVPIAEACSPTVLRQDHSETTDPFSVKSSKWARMKFFGIFPRAVKLPRCKMQRSPPDRPNAPVKESGPETPALKIKKQGMVGLGKGKSVADNKSVLRGFSPQREFQTAERVLLLHPMIFPT